MKERDIKRESSIKKVIIERLESEGFHYGAMESLWDPRQLRLFFYESFKSSKSCFSVVIELKEEE